MVSPALTARIIALRDALPPETAASVVCAGELRQVRESPPLPTRIAGLDRLLGGGLARGKLVEIAGRRSSGRFAAAISTLASATARGENAALVDLGGCLDPEDAWRAGVDLRRLLWIRPRTLKDAVYAGEVTIAAGFPLVILDLGMAPVGRRVPEAAWVRLARSARSHAGALLVTSPFPIAGTAADASIRLAREETRWNGRGAAPKILSGVAARSVVEKKRGERPGSSATIRLALEEAVGDPFGGGETGASSPGLVVRPAGAKAPAFVPAALSRLVRPAR